MRRLMAAAALAVFIGVAGTARADDQPNPTGTWKWTVNFGGNTREATLKLKMDGGKLTGTMLGRNGQETAIEDAKCEKGEVSFKVVRERDGQKFTIKYHGKLKGDAINGKIEFERDGETQAIDWDAKRAKS